MKILIIGDVHIGKSKPLKSHSGLIRQACSQAEATLAELTLKLNKLKPNLIIHMGDAFSDSQNKETDQKNLNKTLKLLNKLTAPKINLLGNHELRAFNLKEINSIYQKNNFVPEFFGFKELNKFNILWLDLKLDENNLAYLPDKTLNWLNKLPASKKPTLVFSHYSLVPIDPTGNYYFKSKPEYMLFKNSKKILRIIKKINPKLCLNAHVHFLSHQLINNTHYISTPAFTENIAGDKFPKNNPGIYSLLDISKNKFIFTSFSRDFCFSKIQGGINNDTRRN